MRSHARAVVVLASTARVPLLSRLVVSLTDDPRVESTAVAATPVTIVRPTRPARGTIVFLNGGTRLGCAHPAVQRLACGMGRAGYTVVVPELPGLKEGRLTPATLEATFEVAAAAAAAEPTGRIVLFGVSAGASLGLLAAADLAVTDCVAMVVAIAPWADLLAVTRLVTTGLYEGAPAGTTSLVRGFVTESLATLSAGGDARPVANLLANKDPERFDALHAALPANVKAAFDQLSPLLIADGLDVPVELVSAADDGYFPIGEAHKLAAALPRVRLTVTSLLDHVRLRPAARGRDLVRLCRLTARSLDAAAGSRPPQGSSKASQPLRFLTVGAGGYVVNLAAFAFLYARGVPYGAAAFLAYLAANAVMYIGNRYFTFRLSHADFWKTYLRYLLVGVLVAAGTSILLAGLVQGVGLDPRIGQALALLLIAPPAFVAFKRWTFRLVSA